MSLILGIATPSGGTNVRVEAGGTLPIYLVERYWPGVTNRQLVEAFHRTREVIKQFKGEGTPVRDIGSTFIPGEEVVFSLYEGPSATVIQQFNERAGIPFSRIVEAILVRDD
jgi:Nickel responsive protein SCO4226-like